MLTWLACRESGCNFRCPVGPSELWTHTTVAHFRGPTVDERTPVVATPRRLTAAWADLISGLELVRHVDHTGRVWAVVLDEFGFTRVDGIWRAGYIAKPGTAGEYGRWPGQWRPSRHGSFRPAPNSYPTDTVVEVLDRWEQATTPGDSDPTPAHGIPRPIMPAPARFLTLVGV